MTTEQLKKTLDSSGIKFAYRKWEEEQKAPFGVFLLVNESNFYADGALYYHVGRYQIELYTAKKSPKDEKRVEAALAAAGIAWEKSEYFIESEKLYQILYECEV